MRFVWVMVPLILTGAVGVQESFATEPSIDTQTMPWITDITTPTTVLLGQDLDLYWKTWPNYDAEFYETDLQNATLKLKLPKGLELLSEGFTESSQNADGDDYHTYLKNVTFSTPEEFEIKLIVRPILEGEWIIEGYVQNTNLDLIGDIDKIKISHLFPLKQLNRHGISSENIICKEGLELIFKQNNSPACVTPETKVTLTERGWVKNECARLFDANMNAFSKIAGKQDDSSLQTHYGERQNDLVFSSEFFKEWRDYGCVETVNDWANMSEYKNFISQVVNWDEQK